jgi:hypothetical protein
MDVTGIVTAANKLPKPLMKKDKQLVGKKISGERGKSITVVCCMDAGDKCAPCF